jgi:hypothetical protein
MKRAKKKVRGELHISSDEGIWKITNFHANPSNFVKKIINV